MTLVQKSINGTEYYTDDKVYYTFHKVKDTADTLWNFACMELGITKKSGFNSQETKAITDLAGISSLHPTKFLLLKNDKAVPVPYLSSGSADLHPDDIILRATVDPAAKPITPSVVSVVPPSSSTKSVADRLKEIEDLLAMKLLSEPEYQDKRAKVIAEL